MTVPVAVPRYHGRSGSRPGGPSAARLKLLAGVERDRPAHALERLRDETARKWSTLVPRLRGHVGLDGRPLVLVVTWGGRATVHLEKERPLVTDLAGGWR